VHPDSGKEQGREVREAVWPFTGDPEELANWLEQHEVSTVAMEATGLTMPFGNTCRKKRRKNPVPISVMLRCLPP
jgi:hypothetical protein